MGAQPAHALPFSGTCARQDEDDEENANEEDGMEENEECREDALFYIVTVSTPS